jgi:hypothetical protein
MLLLKQFNRKNTIRRVEQYGNPKVSKFAELELPKGSILHYVPMHGYTELAPAQTMPMFENAPKAVQVNHITEMEMHGTIGRPRRDNTGVDREIIRYHRINKKMRRMHKETLVERDDRTLLVENYAPLGKAYRYPQTLTSFYDRWHNLTLTMMRQITRDANKYSRQNYFIIDLADFLPSRTKFDSATRRRDASSLEAFTEPANLFLLDIWTWLGKYRDKSLLSWIDSPLLSKVNIIIQYNGKFVNLNLGELDFWRDGEEDKGRIKPRDMQYRFYETIITLAKATIPEEEGGEEAEEETALVQVDRSDVDEDPGEIDFDADVEDTFDPSQSAVEDDEDFEILATEDTTTESSLDEGIAVDEGVDVACQKYIDAGVLTTKEYQRMQNLSAKYKDIPNPFGEGTLADMVEVTPEEVKLEETQLFEDDTVIDQSILKSTTVGFNKKYTENVLPKDIVSSVVSLQRAGVAIDDYKVDTVVDAANKHLVHSLRLIPVKGRPTTVRFTTPLVDEDGCWVANDVKTTMKKQRVDIPIRKTGPDTVALTTFYGKNFIRRCEKATYNRTRWVTNQIVSAGINDDIAINDVKTGNVFNPAVYAPRDYTTVASRVSSFRSGRYIYYFNIDKVDENFGADVVKKLRKQKLTPVAISKNDVFAMDEYSMMYRVMDTGIEQIGTLLEVIGIPTEKEPREYVELSMMGDNIPLGVIMAYYIGLEPLLKQLNVDYTTLEANERVPKGSGDLTIKMKDAKYVINYDNHQQATILNGFIPYLKIMRDFTQRDFDKRDVYLNIIQKDGLGIRYLNELDLMEALYVDPISERILQGMGEPTHFKGLIRRANEMLANDMHKDEVDLSEQHFYGHQRIAGAVYTTMVRGLRNYNNKPGSNKKIDIPNSEVWRAISEDATTMPAAGANPIQSVKENDVTTFGGTGGRSNRSLVKRTRRYDKSNLGIVSGDTADSGDAGAVAQLSLNPKITSLDGMVETNDVKALEPANVYSLPVMLAPGAMYDDDKRKNFIGIQHGSATAADGYVAPSYRTGVEKIVAHRTNSENASIAEAEGTVKEVSEFGITVEYNTDPVKTETYQLGRLYGKYEGGVYPNQKVANFKAGDKFSKGAVLAYNDKFFVPDEFNPEQVNWKLGVYATVALLEGVDTLEDSSAISKNLSVALTSETTKIKNITVGFNQAVHDLVKMGSYLESDDELCVIENELTAGDDKFNDESLDTLRKISSQVPRSSSGGRVERIEVFYNGDIEDMSPSIAEIAKAGDRRRKREAKHSQGLNAETGRIDSTFKVDGNPVEMDTMVIRVYTTKKTPAIGGDKAVFANQMKTTFRRVMTGVNRTDGGLELDAIFGRVSIDNRIVLSVYRIGTTVLLCELISEKAREIYGLDEAA